MQSDRFSQCPALLAEGKRAGQKVHRKIAAVVQKVKSPLLFCPALLKSAKQIVKNHSFRLDHQTDHYHGDGGFQDGGIRDGEKVDGEIVEGGC
jgi:hypothetical protein